MSEEPTRPRPSPVWWGALLAVVVVLVYLPALGGDWVWDDWTWKDHDADAFLDELGRQVYGGIWRPLSSLSVLAVHLLWPAPLPHKLVNLGLHLVSVAAVARAARALGARPAAAWFGAALFALHPGVSETVAWIGARTEIVPATLLLVGLAAWLEGRRGVAAACLFAAPFAKEAYVVGVVSLAVWMWTLRRFDARVFGAAVAGAVAFLAARVGVVGASIEGARYVLDPIPAFGGAALRGARLVVDTTAADLWNPYEGAPTLGILVLLAGVGATVLARGRVMVGALVASLPPLVPSVLAASSTLLLADRYYYVPFAGLGLVAALGAERVAARGVRSGLVRVVGFGLPLALGLATARRATEWRSELDLATASWARHPDNPMAAEHYAYAEERWGEGCEAALGAWRVAATLTHTGGAGLLRCLVAVGRHGEALALAPTLRPSLDTAWTASLAAEGVGDLHEAERWARAATEADPRAVAAWVRLGWLLALQRRDDEARAAYTHALGLAPEDPDARAGLAQLGAGAP